MTVLLSCRKLKKEFGDNTVFEDINFDVASGDKIGLVGLNGSGKSTLANILYGDIDLEGGTLLWHKKNIEVGYLGQSLEYCQGYWSEMLQKEAAGEFSENSKWLGINDIDKMDEGKFNTLSGGEKIKLMLSLIWAKSPDLLILDEPTNHLDYQGVQWLIKEIGRYEGAILIISHDRYFLDSTVNKIIELREKKSEVYYGNYSFYREERKRRYENQLNQYLLQESYKAKIQEDIKRLKNWSDKAHRESREKARACNGQKEYFRMKAKKKDRQVKSKVRRLEKIELEGVDKPKEDKKINFKFDQSTLKGVRVVEAIDIKKSFGKKLLFQNSSFFVTRGEKVGIFGGNGCGKTTLLKALIGEVSLDQGEVFVSKSVKIGYLSQEPVLTDNKSKVLEVFDFKDREEEGKIRTLLASMGFDEKMISQPLETLSQGELTRIRLARLIAKQQDVLILDEPLNHLDIYSREKLEEELKNYQGTLLVVSHDRYMLENICQCLLVFDKNKIRKTADNPKEYFIALSSAKEKEDYKQDSRQLIEEKLLIDNEIAFILGEFSKYSPESEEYKALDSKYKNLINRKRQIG